MGLVRGFCLLLVYLRFQDWNSFWISSCCPVLGRSWRFVCVRPVPSCTSVVHWWRRCWGGPNSKTRIWASERSELLSLPALLISYPCGWHTSNTCRAALPCSLGEVQDSLSQVLQAMRDMASSSTLKTPGPAFLPALVSEGRSLLLFLF